MRAGPPVKVDDPVKPESPSIWRIEPRPGPIQNSKDDSCKTRIACQDMRALTCQPHEQELRHCRKRQISASTLYSGTSPRAVGSTMERPDRNDDRLRTPYQADRRHQGKGHWHVERRSGALICMACRARIPRSVRPAFCPNCGAGTRKRKWRGDPSRSQ